MTIEKKRIANWVQTRNETEAALTMPTPPRIREPLLWLSRAGNELFFVNGGSRLLARLTTSQSVTALVDRGVFRSDADDIIEYRGIEPGEAVKIDAYDEYLDLDHVLGATLVLDLGTSGRFACYVAGIKGGVREQILRWADGTWHNRVAAERLPDDS